MSRRPQPVPASAARRLFLGAQGLLGDPGGEASEARVARLIDALGFVQLDSINVVARAHDLTLASRLDGYRPEALASLLARRSLFEHWTHDASAIPTAWYAHWKPRFRRDGPQILGHAWWRERIGRRSKQVVAEVLERIRAEGPLTSADFEHPGKREAWWGWKPHKAALDYLWRIGELAVRGRVNFHKVYDLAERVLPEHHALPEPAPEAHVAWACRTAAERLAVFTPRELAGYWDAIELAAAREWCLEAARAQALVPVEVESADGSPGQVAWALADWEERLRALPEPPRRMRLLSPFDPVLRDRARALRRFGFDYRFEAFTPEAKRRHGYYAMPILDGERLVGRLDPKLHREQGVLEIRGLWWEPGARPSRARLEDALARLAGFVGAREVRPPR